MRSMYEDRISELPEHLKLYILSKLSTKESMKSTILSKAWRDVWLTQPSLDFDKKFFKQTFSKGGIDIKTTEAASIIVSYFFDFIDRVLERRNQMLKSKQVSTELNLFVLAAKSFMPYRRTDRCLDFAVTNFQVTKLTITYSDRFFEDRHSYYSLPKHVLPGTPYLKVLSLTKVRLDQQTINNLAVSCPLIQWLELDSCNISGDVIKISGLRELVAVEMTGYLPGTKRVEIDAPSVRYFRCICHTTGPDRDILEIEVGAACKRLTILRMYNVGLTEDSLNRLQSTLLRLQELKLTKCFFPKRLKISSPSLRLLVLEHCLGLVELHIDAPKLNFFGYVCSFISTVPAVFSWNAFAPYKTSVTIEGPKTLDMKLVEFMRQLVQRSRSFKGSIRIAKHEKADLAEIREKCLPVYGMSRLRLSYDPDPEFILAANNILNVLWLFPNLKTLVICQRSVKVQVNLQFKYKEEVEGSENSWQQRLEEVMIKTIRGSELNLTPLRNLFEDAEGANKIVVHVDQ